METNASLWDEAKSSIAVGETVTCIVTEHCPYGVLVSLAQIPVWGVIERIRMGRDGYQTPEEYPLIGSVITATVLGFRDYSRQIELAMPTRTTGQDSTFSLNSVGNAV